MLKRTILESSTWLLGGSAYVAFIGLLSSIFLMRILDPVAFGVVASMAAINGLFEIFRDFGIGRCIIFASDEELAATSNVSLMTNLAVGVLFSAALFLGATIIAKRMNIEENYLNAIRLLSLNPLINSAISTFDNHLQRRLLFRHKVLTEAASTTGYALIATVLAFSDCGIWSIIIAQQVAAVALTVGYYIGIAGSWKPVMSLKGVNYDKVLPMGGHFTISSVIVYIYNNLDNMAVAVLLGPQQLGYYSRSYNYAMMSSGPFGNLIAKITGPLYTKLAGSVDKLSQAVRTVYVVFGIFVPPTFMFGIIFARDLVLLAVGLKWLPMVLPLQILMIFSALRLISSSASNVFPALGKHRMISLLPLVYLLSLALLVYPGTKWLGITGTCLAVLATAVVGGSISMIAATRMLKLDIMSCVKPLIKASVFCVSAWFIFRYVLVSTDNSMSWLGVRMTIYVLLYASFAVLIMKKELMELPFINDIWMNYRG